MEYNIRENEDGQTDDVGLRLNQDLILTTKGNIDDIVTALEKTDNYGIYKSNMRKPNVNKALEDHFGPSIPSKKKPLEKQRGTPFPIKTKQAVDDFMQTLSLKPNLLTYYVSNNKLVFPEDSNESKSNIESIIKTVMKNADITDYKLSTQTSGDSSKSLKEINNYRKLRQIIKEEIKKYI